MKTNYRALTGLRFFAAIAVVFYHYAPAIRGVERLPGPLQNLIHRGPVALCFFFVLSGFVLAINYRDRAMDSWKTRQAFWLARFVRLYPAYILAFLLFLPMALQKYVLHPATESVTAAHRTFVAGAILSPLLLQSWTSYSQAWNGPSWSLSVEAFFYFLFPYIALRLMRQRTVVAMTVTAGVWVVSLALVYADVTGYLPHQFFQSHIRYHPIFWAPCFVAGIGIARFVLPWQRVPRATASTVAVLALAGLILICALCPLRYGEFVVTTGLLPLLALLILACSHQSSGIVKILGMSPLHELGEVSYVTYIIQAPMWHFVAPLTNRLAGYRLLSQQVSAWQFLVFLPILLWTSFFISRYFEKPTRGWIADRYLTRREAAMNFQVRPAVWLNRYGS
jgi:peptidoglycan/LPS O-acetylase OafA/YrhL